MNESARSLPHLAGGRPATADDWLLERRQRLVAPHIPPTAERLLDFGCGNGAQTLLLAERFRQVFAVDIEPRYLDELAREAAARGWQDRILPTIYDGRRLPCGDGSMDCAVSFEVLEHVADERESLAELHRVLRPGGVLILTVPNRWWIFETHGASLPLLPWNRVPFFSWLPERIHDRWARARIYRRRGISRLIAASGFTVLESQYVTAPLDVLRWAPLQRLLRATLFRRDSTGCPFLATAIFVVARR